MLHGLVRESQAVEGQPARQGGAPKVWLAKAEGPDCMSSNSQQDLKSGMLKVNRSALSKGGRVVEPQEDRAQLRGGTKALASASLSHPSAKIAKGTN